MTQFTCRRAFVAGAAAAAGLAALPAQAQTRSKPTGVSPADLARHEKYMRLAIAQANRNPGRPFGSVIVDERNGEVVGEGVVNMSANPMYHSEVVAMNDYISRHGNKDWEHVTMYGTGEACPMCMSAMVWAGIPRMVYGSDTPFVRKYVANINIRARDVVAAAHPLYTNKLLLGGVLSDITDKMFEERAKVGRQK
ncbi:nucleoside deaminase [Bradyrhizobium lablabi]|uniref:nucleoside deaminase n=1 Tax=Bradyrhizobium lablabi TaxID=722472 RepID=UPI001BA6B138|nr:nucleoside deaminase [Bradyrhizobium lablabi]MBR1122295.1 nucleoside deaminase [Bradyrhizobium lablabi]